MISRLLTCIAIVLGLSCHALAQSINQAPGAGARPVHFLSAVSTNSTLVKGGPATLYGVQAVNTTAVLYYLKFYDKATAPTCNTDTVVKTLPIPFGATSAGGAIVAPMTVGVAFLNGLGFCITAGIADNDNTNAAVGVVVNLDYK